MSSKLVMTKKWTALSVNKGLCSNKDQRHRFPINYVYDYLEGRGKYLTPPLLKLNGFLRSKSLLELNKSLTGGVTGHSDHGIDVDPIGSELPWASGILLCRQSKYWKLCIGTTNTLLEHFATDESVQKIFKSENSIADIARKELSGKVEEGWAKFPPYFYPDVDKQRIKLLASLMVFIFIFDDFWEIHDIDSFNTVHNMFIRRMASTFVPTEGHRSGLILLIDQITAEIKELDHDSGNKCGHHMLDTMVAFFSRPPPPKEYKDLEEYMSYRHLDVANNFVLSCVAFGLNSSVDFNSPQLATYVRLWGDHVSIANDLGSWHKEKEAYDSGQVLYMINIVDVVQNLLRLPTDAAVAMVYALQLQVETEIDAEIERLRTEDCLTIDEWRFINASLYVSSGNVMSSIVMSRYGGEKTRLQESTE